MTHIIAASGVAAVFFLTFAASAETSAPTANDLRSHHLTASLHSRHGVSRSGFPGSASVQHRAYEREGLTRDPNDCALHGLHRKQLKKESVVRGLALASSRERRRPEADYGLGTLYAIGTAFLLAVQEPFSALAARTLSSLDFMALTQVALMFSLPFLIAREEAGGISRPSSSMSANGRSSPSSFSSASRGSRSTMSGSAARIRSSPRPS